MRFQTTKKLRPITSRSQPAHRNGLSLIELLIVIAIVIILGLILLTVFTKTYKLVQSWRGDASEIRPVSLV